MVGELNAEEVMEASDDREFRWARREVRVFAFEEDFCEEEGEGEEKEVEEEFHVEKREMV